jgi:acyl dehydratase
MNRSLLNIPAEERFFEDYIEGSVYEFGSVKVEETEVIEFGLRYDPQPFHMNPEVARATKFGGIIASGWHTAGMAMRLLVENYLPRGSALGSPGVDQLRWHKPVRPGDTLSVRVTIVETKPSKSKPDRGLLRSFVEVINQRDEVVTSWRGMMVLLRRNKPL